jgi:hypothetical protein
MPARMRARMYHYLPEPKNACCQMRYTNRASGLMYHLNHTAITDLTGGAKESHLMPVLTPEADMD